MLLPMPSAGSKQPTLSGRTIEGRYLLEHPLGSGAVGTVFAARDTESGQQVACKLWHGTSDTQGRARFIREAKALDTLRHPHIVEVYAAGLFEDQPYVVMEHLQGQSLEDMLLGGEPLPGGLAMTLMRQVLSALAYAHQRGVVHRDLKPDNIYVCGRPGEPPVVKLLDYGLAKFLGPDDDPLGGAQITVSGMVMGTPLYMPPEQAAGGSIDVRVDVYAAGCIFFEMLSGRPPYLGEDFGELIRAHITAPIPLLSEAVPNKRVTPAVQSLFDRAMAKDPDARFKDAGEMLAALQALPDTPLQPAMRAPAAKAARTLSAAEPPAAPGLPRSLILGAAAGLAVVLLGVLAFLTL